MINEVLVIIFLTTLNFYCSAQKKIQYVAQPGAIKVVINSFYKSPPNCGFEKNTSVYEAEVTDSLSVLQGEKILICVKCKSDVYPATTGNHFIIKLSDDCRFFEGIYNFTGYSEEEIKTRKKYNILSLQEDRFD
jgi:hypothetical protein